MDVTVSHTEKAVQLFMEGCNCSQAVFAAYADDVGMSKETALRLSSSFGGGMGRLREVCGTVSAMFLVAGLLAGYSDVADKSLKDRHYQLIQQLAAEFREAHGSIICRDILKTNDTSPVSAERTPEFYRTRPCVKCIVTATEILDRHFFGEPKAM